MKAAYLSPRILVFIGFLVFVYTLHAQDFSAGINTESPNPNAVLHLVAPNGDQGLLIPTLTTVERIAMILAATDNGMLVFDTTDGLFYYYFNGWIALTTGATELDGDITNELITAGTLVGNDLIITESGTDHIIDLSAFASAPQDLQFAGNLLSITGDPTPTTVDFSSWDQNASDDLTTANVGTAANQVVQLDGTGALPAVDGSNLTGILNTVTTDGTTVTGDGSGTPLAVGTVPSGQVSGLAAVATSGSFADLLLQPVGLADGDDIGLADGTTILGDGVGTPYNVNVGTAANQILQLDGTGALPAVDGSNLTGINTALAVGSVTTTEILDGTIADIDISSVDWSKITTGVPAGFADGTDDGLTAVTTDITLVGDGTGATPLSVNRVNPAIIAGGGATSGQILEFDGANWVPIANTATVDGTTITGDGDATALVVNVGTGPNQIVQLNGTSQLPAVDGSLLTNVNASTLAVDAVTSANIANGTIVDIDVSGTANIAATKLESTVMVASENISLLNNDAGFVASGDNVSVFTNDAGYLVTVTSDATLNGDGGATPLAVNVGTAANQIVQLDGLARLPIVDGSQLTNVVASSLAAGSVGTTEIADGSIADIDVGAVGWMKLTGVPAGFADNTDDGLITVSVDGTTIVGNGAGTPLSVNVGNGANQIVQLNGTSQLPAVDGSLLTNVAATSVANNSVFSTSISDGEIVDIDISGTAGITATKLESVVMVEGEDVGLLNNAMVVTTYDPTSIAGDAFEFGTHFSTTTANPGDVLTFGGGTWDAAAPPGLTLPYSQTVGDAADLFFLTNTLTGGAGNFAINNMVNAANALNASTNGTGSAFSVTHAGAGVGIGVDVSMTQATSSGPALSINHAGLGAGIEINTTTGPPLIIPGGTAGQVLTSDIAGNITLQPGGLTLPYSQTVTDPGDLFYLVNDGTGGAGAFQILNAANTATALSANTNGSGSVILASHTGASGPGIEIDVTGGANPNAGLLVNHAGTGPGIEVTTAAGPNMILNGSTPFQIPTGATVGYVLTSLDASGNTVWAPPLTLPYANTVADPGTLFDITNSGAGAAASFTSTGIAALFSTTGATSAIQVDGDIEFLDGASRFIGIPTSTTGPGDLLTVISGAAGGAGGNGGDLNLRSGDAFTAGDGGNIIIAPGAGAGVGNFGQVLVNGVTRFGNPNAGLGGAIELEDDGGANAVVIQADPLTTAYSMTFPTANASGVLTNDGAGALTWAPSGLTFPSSTVQADADTLFNLTNPGSGPAAGFSAAGVAAYFTSTAGLTAVQVDGNMEFLDGAPRDFGILPNLAGPGDILNVYSGDAAGPGGNGGDLVLSSGLGAGVGNGGNILLVPGAGAGGGFTGGVFVNGITRFGNPNAGFGGLLELENDGGTASIGIEADPAMAGPYTITLPATQGTGSLTNDGAGNLSWSVGGGAFSEDANQNLIAVSAAAPTGIDNFIAGNGAGSLTSGNNNIAIGEGAGGALAGGSDNFFMGFDVGGPNMINGSSNILFGSGGRNTDDSNNNIGIGQNVSVAGGSTTSIGSFSAATGVSSIALATGSSASGTNSIAIGNSASAAGNNSIALGTNVFANTDNTAIIGDPGSPLNVGIGTTSPISRLEVQTFGGETLDALSLVNNADAGHSLSINVPATINANPAILVAQNSDGGVIDARINNAASNAPLISAQHQGDGNVAFFNQANNLSGADAMFVQTLGNGGSAGVFQISNTGSTAPALAVNTDGDNSNAIAISNAGLNGVGIAIDMNNQGAQGIFVGGTNPASTSIETDGDVLFRANLITPPLNHDAVVQPVIPSDARIVKINNAPANIDQIAPGVEGQEIMLIGDAGVTGFNIITGGNLRLDNNANHPMIPGASIHFVYIETLNLWVEISRSR